MSEMKQLLEKWAEAEPGRCSRGVYSYAVDGRIVYSLRQDATEVGAEMWIQWAVQQAIIKRNLSLDIHYGATGWDVFVEGYEGFAKGKATVAEALLEAYLDAIEEVER
jgi:hypothetical protein